MTLEHDDPRLIAATTAMEALEKMHPRTVLDALAMEALEAADDIDRVAGIHRFTIDDETVEKIAGMIVRAQSGGHCNIGAVCGLCDCSAKYDPRMIVDRDNYARDHARAILDTLKEES